MGDVKRMIVGVSGASGAPLAAAFLTALRRAGGWESHLVMTQGARLTLGPETGLSVSGFQALADVVYDPGQVGAAIASGSFGWDGMAVVPCSMKTLAGIACGYSDNLLLRAADVTLKERRRLVLAARETPLSAIHLRNMLTLTEMGAVILPPVLTYYHQPGTVEDMPRQFTGKLLDQFGIQMPGYGRWDGEACGYGD